MKDQYPTFLAHGADLPLSGWGTFLSPFHPSPSSKSLLGQNKEMPELRGAEDLTVTGPPALLTLKSSCADLARNALCTCSSALFSFTLTPSHLWGWRGGPQFPVLEIGSRQVVCLGTGKLS